MNRVKVMVYCEHYLLLAKFTQGAILKFVKSCNIQITWVRKNNMMLKFSDQTLWNSPS